MKSVEESTEKRLAEAIARLWTPNEDHNRAVTELYVAEVDRATARLIKMTSSRAAAQDIFHDALMKFIRLTKGRAELLFDWPTPQKRIAYWRRSLINQANDWLLYSGRELAKRRALAKETQPAVIADGEKEAARPDFKKMAHRLNDAVRELEEPSATIFQLGVIEQRRHSDIANELNRREDIKGRDHTANSVKVRLSRLRKKLANKIGWKADTNATSVSKNKSGRSGTNK